MNVKEILDGMADRAFAYSFLQGVNDLYSSLDYGDTEPDYQTGFNRLLEILTDDQKETLNRMEGIYTERRYYAAEYGFKCGLYGAFRQFFGCSGAKDGGFQDLVADDLLTQPKMQRHHTNYANIELCNQIDARSCRPSAKKSGNIWYPLPAHGSNGSTVPQWMDSIAAIVQHMRLWMQSIPW